MTYDAAKSIGKTTNKKGNKKMNKLSIMISGIACAIACVVSAEVEIPAGTPTSTDAVVVDMSGLSDEYGTRYLNFRNGVYDESDPRWNASIYNDPELFDNEAFHKFLKMVDIADYTVANDVDWPKLFKDYDVYRDSDEVSLAFESGKFANKFKKAETVSGILYDSEEMAAGTVQVKASKRSKNDTVSISATVKLFETGKKYSAKATLAADGDSKTLALNNPIGKMQFVLAADGYFSLGNEAYSMKGGVIGGELDAESLSFSMDGSVDEVDLGDDWCPLSEAGPDGAEITVKKGVKWDCGKAASIKYKKDRDSGMYELTGLDDEKKPNLSALKLSYSYKTGEFKGSFKLYASNECSDSDKPKLKAYTVSVSGIVIDGVGYGTAVLKKPNYKWNVTIN